MSGDDWKLARDLHAKVRALTGWAATSDVDEVDAEFSAALDRAEASAAAMREALGTAREACRISIERVPAEGERVLHAALREADAALANDAGRAKLDEMENAHASCRIERARAEKAEAEVERLKRALDANRRAYDERQALLEKANDEANAAEAARDEWRMKAENFRGLYERTRDTAEALRAEVEATRAELHAEALLRKTERESALRDAQSWKERAEREVLRRVEAEDERATLRAEVERLRAESESESATPTPVGRCPKCGAAWYIDVGTCGCGL